MVRPDQNNRPPSTKNGRQEKKEKWPTKRTRRLLLLPAPAPLLRHCLPAPDLLLRQSLPTFLAFRSIAAKTLLFFRLPTPRLLFLLSLFLPPPPLPPPLAPLPRASLSSSPSLSLKCLFGSSSRRTPRLLAAWASSASFWPPGYLRVFFLSLAVRCGPWPRRCWDWPCWQSFVARGWFLCWRCYVVELLWVCLPCRRG